MTNAQAPMTNVSGSLRLVIGHSIRILTIMLN